MANTFLTGAKITIPAYRRDNVDRPFDVVADGVRFAAYISWCDSDDPLEWEDTNEWMELGSQFGKERGFELDNEDAIIYAAEGRARIVVVRNKDGIYQSRAGRITAVSRNFFVDRPDELHVLTTKVFA